jgi:hypothetical protein
MVFRRRLYRLLHKARHDMLMSEADRQIREIDERTGRLLAQVQENLRARHRIEQERNGGAAR